LRLRTLLFVGLAIRLAIAPFFAHPYDVYVWYVSGESLLNGTTPVWSFLTPYSYSYFLFAFPAAIAFRALSAIFGSHTILISSLPPQLNPGAFWNITLVPGPLFDLLVKLPLIASDTLVAVLLYRMVLRHLGDENLALSAATAWFLNPLVIWVSSGWGMFDTLPALFTVISLYFVLEKRFAYSGLAIVIAIALKFYAGVLVIPLLIIARKEGGDNGLRRILVSIVLSSTVLFLPFADRFSGGFAAVVAGTSYLMPVYAGLSFWSSIVLFWPIPSLPLVSSILIVVFLAGLYYWMARSSTSGVYVYAAYFGLSIIPLLLLFRFVAENYFVWLIPFAAIFSLQQRRGRILLWGLSLVALLSSVTESLLPYYMLPIAPWIGRYLVEVLSLFSPYRVTVAGVVTNASPVGKLYLSGLGIISAAFLCILTIYWVSTTNRIRADNSRSSQPPEIDVSAVRTEPT
jgi:Gpi18-like mannosyltransferase